MKYLAVTVMAVCLCSLTSAETGKWTYKGMLAASYNQTQVSPNWPGGENNTSNWSAKLDASAEKSFSKTNWLNILKTEYGKSKIAGGPQQESSDLFKFDSIYTWKLNAIVDPFLSGSIETQYSEFYDPATYIETAGVGRTIIEQKPHLLKTRAGVAFRQKFDKKELIVGQLNQYTSSVDNPKTAKIEEVKTGVGAEWVTNYEWLISENTKFISEAKVFDAFDGGASVCWDSGLYVKLSKYFTLQLSYLAIYDYSGYSKPVWPNDIETRMTTAIGFSYNIF